MDARSREGRPAASGRRTRLALHVCCGPCATVALERLVPRYDVMALWYNPNITDPGEHAHRLEAAPVVCEHYGVALAVLEYEPESFLAAVRGLEGEPEGGARCKVCVANRLAVAADWAASQGLAALTTTLTLGPQKDPTLIHGLGEAAAARRGLAWLAETFRKEGGVARSVELSRELGLYRQDFCGCSFSRRERRRQDEA